MRRLSKVEYRNTLHDLYGVDPSIADSLPEEVVGEGYLNSISPMQSELFFDIANKVIAQVVAPEGQQPTEIQSASSAILRLTTATTAARPAKLLARWPATLTVVRPPTRNLMCWWASSTLVVRTS
jgi:hypothetical protein